MKLKLVVLNSPYQNWQRPKMAEYFSKMVELKFNGYRKNYPAHYLPVETTDLIGIHHLVFVEDQGREVLLSGFKTVFLEQCDFHRIVFPVVAMMSRKGQAGPEHQDSVLKTIETAKKNEERVSYSSSWTINPDYKDKPELAQAAKELCVAMLYWHSREYEIKNEFLLGVVKAKTDLFFMNYGYKPISIGPVELPAFEAIDVDHKEVRMLYREQFNSNANQLLEKYDLLFQECTVIGSPFGLANEFGKERQAA